MAEQKQLEVIANENPSVTGLRRQPTKYPHGLNITVQTIGGNDDEDNDLGSVRDHGDDYWSETQKYRIGMLGSPETLAELQVRRYKYPLTANYYLNGKMDNPMGKPTPWMLLGYAQRACRWKYLRWPIIFVASVLLFFGLITYCLWLHDVSVARAKFLQRRYEATSTSTSPSSSHEVWDEETTGSTEREPQETTRLKAVDEEKGTDLPEITFDEEEQQGDDDYDDTLLPADSIRFTSGHQNSFGVPIEQDKRMLQLLKDLLPKPQATPAGNEQPLTRVSPTLPPPSAASSRPTQAMTFTTTPSTSDSGCQSTMLPMCQGVLDYDLTYNREGATPRDAVALVVYEELIRSNCSARAAEFVCAALEPECRPSHIGQLPPCRRICKAIFEACSVPIANSDILSELFDCSLYPDAHESHKCEDPTRRRDHCYTNEFQCHDGSCIPQNWQCDKIKDCLGGEDEDEQCLVCEDEEFRCRSNEKCIPENLRCDLNLDCFDGSDEEDCDDYGSGDAAPFDEAELNAFPRVFSYASFLSPNETNDKLYTYITATTDEDAGTETKFQIHQVAAPVPVNASAEESSGGPKGFVNFRDSKEIMMTSDSENKFKYSQRSNRTSVKFSVATATTPAARTASAIPGSALAQQRERERVTSSTSTTTTPKPPTTVATPTEVVTAPGGCLPHELRCLSGKCITVSQLCDKQIDCPDAADELMCVYRERPIARRTTTTSPPTPTPTTTITTTTKTTTSTSTSSNPVTSTRRPLRTTPSRSRKPKS
ncbi:hypothetical protein KR054_006085 [Drosophila jambulina]|nr:hypothetical protein KR054_006085 [Drosophila jambulina]